MLQDKLKHKLLKLNSIPLVFIIQSNKHINNNGIETQAINSLVFGALVEFRLDD